MKKQLLCLCAIAGVGMAVQAAEAESEEGFYGKFDAGIAITDKLKYEESIATEAGKDVLKADLKIDTGIRLDLAGGYRFNKSWAVELETGIIFSSIDSLKITETEYDIDGNVITTDSETIKPDATLYQIPVLANVIYTMPLEGNLKPYLGAGAGGVATIVDGDGVSESDFTFAWQVMAGADYKINERWSAGLAYKLLGTSGPTIGDIEWDSFMTHSIVAVVTCKF